MNTPPMQDSDDELEEEHEEHRLTRREVLVTLGQVKQTLDRLAAEYTRVKQGWRHHGWCNGGMTYKELATTILPALVRDYAHVRTIKQAFPTVDALCRHLVQLDGDGPLEQDPLAVGRVAGQWYAAHEHYKRLVARVNDDLRAKGDPYRYPATLELPADTFTPTANYRNQTRADYAFFTEYKDEHVRRLADTELEWYDNDKDEEHRQHLEMDWEDTRAAVRGVDRQLAALVDELIEYGYANAQPHRDYGAGAYEDAPPWLRASLLREVHALEQRVREAQLELEHVRMAGEMPKSLDTLRLLYTGKGKLRANASEANLRAQEKAAQEARMQTAEATLRHYRTLLDHAQERLRVYEEKSASSGSLEEVESRGKRTRINMALVGKRAGRRRRRSRSTSRDKGGGVSAEKAREILHHGTVHGHPLTDAQRRYFGWLSNK